MMAAPPFRCVLIGNESLLVRCGERLLERGTLERSEDAAYLTVEERLAAVNDPAGLWALHLESRIDRVRGFGDLEVPAVFWGTPQLAS